MNTKVIDFTIGADPELTLLRANGDVVEAADYCSLGGTGDEEFGADGNGYTFELRPAPSKNPLQVVNTIRDIFVRKVINESEFLEFNWVSGSYHSGYPLGGHVHFGLTNRQVNYTDAIAKLDNYVGLVCLMLENRTDGINRRHSNRYGCMGDYRVQPWGLEYRSMSSWLSSPYIASAMLCLSKTVMYEMVNNSKFDWHKFAVKSDFPTMNHKRIIPLFPKIWEDITKMHLYQLYKPYLDLIYFLVTNKRTWLPTTSLKDNWGVIDMTPCISSKINIDLIWNRFNAEK